MILNHLFSNVRNCRPIHIGIGILAMTISNLCSADPTVLKYSFNSYVVDFGNVEVDSYIASASGYDCQRQQSPIKPISFNLGVVQGENPNFPMNRSRE